MLLTIVVADMGVSRFQYHVEPSLYDKVEEGSDLDTRLKLPEKHWVAIEKHLLFARRRITYDVIPFVGPFASECTAGSLYQQTPSS